MRNSVILIVDDEEMGRAPLRLLLEKNGCIVIEASSGAEALAIIATNHVDVAIIDCMMPGMSGLELAVELNNLGTAFIGTTAARDDGIIAEWDRLGSVGYIDKPIQLQQVLASVKVGLRYVRRVTALESAVENSRALSGAIAIICCRLGLSVNDAKKFLATESNRRRVKLHDLATEIMNQVDARSNLPDCIRDSLIDPSN